MLSVDAYVWKYYCGQILEFFQRDGDKPISVEIEVFDYEEIDDKVIAFRKESADTTYLLNTLNENLIGKKIAILMIQSGSSQFNQKNEKYK